MGHSRMDGSRLDNSLASNADDNDVEYAVVDEAEENTDITDENNNSDYSDEEDEVEYY